MLPAERRAKLQEWFSEKVVANSQELARVFNTSISTIRRDLDYLASLGLVRRTHGGAVRLRRLATFEPSIDEARVSAVEEKRAIARVALSRIERDQSLFLDTGSTLHELARLIAELDVSITVVTNDILIAHILTSNPAVKLVMAGGSRREGAYSLLGEPAISFLSDLRCDQFFMTAQAIDLQCLSDISPELVQLKRAMLASADRTIVMVDSSKFATRAFYRVADLGLVHEVITDSGLSEDERERFAARNITLTIAPLGSEGAA
jgi:DeoR/GlpR family transcriptional regulator of sugar metabolism